MAAATTTSAGAARDAGRPASREAIAARLAAVRERTLSLVEQLSDEALNAVHDPLMSPIVWDLGHVATFEDLWLVQAPFDREPLRGDLSSVYDPASAPRSERGALPFLRSEQAFAYMDAVRERTLDALERADLSSAGARLLNRGFVYEMVLRHEQQHSETILQALQIMTVEAYAPGGRWTAPAPDPLPSGMAEIPGGRFEMGASPEGFAYDNERPRHVREVAPFLIDRTPVTNEALLEFIDDGGYQRREWWSAEGWEWRVDEGVEAPRYWRREGDSWLVRSFSRWSEVDPALPACHVSWYEADAFARYAGKRLPTETEWERAVGGDRAWSGSRELANLDQRAFGCAPAGAYAAGEGPYGMRQAAGDVWEWTASPFEPYDGFEAFPYPEYSAEFFGGPFKVLRGGSWATQAGAVTSTFRNWDYPRRRQIFAGFRCAADFEER